MEELKPCPFCGSDPIGPHAGDDDWWIECEKCEIVMDNHSKRALIANWNTRPTPDSIKDIQWQGECSECGGTGGQPCSFGNKLTYLCAKCNGKGQVASPATLEDCQTVGIETIKKVEKLLAECELPTCEICNNLRSLVTINNGTLRVKEK